MDYPDSGEGAPHVLVTASVTRLGLEHRGQVVVSGSHGGRIAAALAARGGVRAVIFNDATVGLDHAGIAGLDDLAEIGMAAAAVDAWSARIGDGADMLASGIISFANPVAAALGVQPGMTVATAARLLCGAPQPRAEPPMIEEAACLLQETPGGRPVWGLDTVSLACATYDGSIIMTGSHGGLLDGQPAAALKCAACAAVYNDAGIGKDEAGLGRLAALDLRGIAAATVDARTARIGDARSTWTTGVISRCNRTATDRGARPGLTAREFAALFAAPPEDNGEAR
jgi:hypothetical protein